MENKKFCKFCGEEIDKESIVCPKCGRQLKVVKNKEVNNSSNNIETKNDDKPKFYTETWFMWVMLIFFAPVGIFLMWKFNDKMKKNTKIILTVVFALFFLIIAVGGSSEENANNESNTSNNSNPSSEVSKKKVQIIDFSGMKENEILTWCKENNLDCNFKREYSNSVEKDGYIKQNVEADKEVAENSKITITYSLGKEPTVSQQNAVKKAKSYLNYSAFSRKGLIEQLEFEGFSNEDSIYGVDNVSVDWNEQAVKKAKSYLNHSAFSRKGLIEQLEFEGFTHEQAVYGVEQNGL